MLKFPVVVRLSKHVFLTGMHLFCKQKQSIGYSKPSGLFHIGLEKPATELNFKKLQKGEGRNKGVKEGDEITKNGFRADIKRE